MRVIKPIVMDNTALVSSNVAENDHAEWNVGTAYVIGDRVIVIGTTHKIYECVANNTGNDPVTDDGTFWIEVSATNRWKAFDRKLADVVTNATTIEYEILAPSLCDNIALFRLNGETVRVVVTDTSPAVVYDETFDLVDTSDIVDWFTFYTWSAVYDADLVITGVPAYTGYTIDITVSAPAATAEVGEIVLGKMHNLGTTMAGTSIGTLDFSRKERDTFGNAIIIERAFSDTVDFKFAINVGDEKRVKRVLDNLRATAAVFYAGPANRGTTIYGFHNDLDIPLSSAGVSYASLEVEGLT